MEWNEYYLVLLSSTAHVRISISAHGTRNDTDYLCQLEKMQGPLDDREIDRLMEREQMRSDRFRQEL
jgi:hypothetical protein